MVDAGNDRSGAFETWGYERSAHLYDLFDEKPNIPFFRRHARQAAEALDIGAGTGRIAIPLAESGVAVWCVEPSPAMRRVLNEKLTARPGLRERIHVVSAGATAFRIDRRFPVAYMSGVFDHFIGDEERRKALENVACHLAPGGRLVFDSFLGWMRTRPPAPAGVVRRGRREIRRTIAWTTETAERGRVDLVFEIYEDGRLVERIEETSGSAILTRGGIHRDLRESGFAIRNEWRNYEEQPFRPGDELLVIEAEKVA
ncbi:MAG: methyltransferase domain-containing protein [Candidatus Eisenbacteria bacterium]|nr:methyltransferase domain-containing protein [Candidatus Eisenbacteria bacterium]